MSGREPIVVSIVVTMSLLFAAQCAFFSLLFVKFSLPVRVEFLFIAVAAAYEGVLLVLLLRRKHQFRIEPEGRDLTRVNFANILTLVRLTSLPSICFMIVLTRNHPMLVYLVVFVAAVFLTDLIDGQLSRRTHQVTAIGKLMDSFSDYLVLMVISIAFLAYGLIPVWFFVLIFVRGFSMVVGMAIITRLRGYLRPDTSLIGKASIFAVMVLYAYRLLELALAGRQWAQTLGTVLIWVVGLFVVVSVADKAIYFRGQAKELRRS